MNVLAVLMWLAGTSVHAKPSLFAFPTYYEQLAAAAPRHNLLHSVKSQFHAQDELGQYAYGYNDGLSSKVESKTADGITQGSYAYVDSNGILQNVNYISDDVNGFRVSASNLPTAHGYRYPVLHQDAPATALLAQENPTQTILALSTEDLKASAEAQPTESISPTDIAEHLKSTESSRLTTIEKQNATEIAADVTSTLANVSPTTATVFPTYSTYQPFTHLSWYPQPALAPLPLTSFRYEPVAQVAPVAQVSHIAPVYSQFHSQDEYGQYSYGYSGGPSSKMEIKTLDGITRGGYSYVDANGILQKVNYISDPINGFRVAATNLPISNIATAYYPAEYQLPELNLLAHSDKSKND